LGFLWVWPRSKTGPTLVGTRRVFEKPLGLRVRRVMLRKAPAHEELKDLQKELMALESDVRRKTEDTMSGLDGC
jgi:hypothetical protein